MTGPKPMNPVGRLKDLTSTIVNVQLPFSLVEKLDRHLDWVETPTGKRVNRGTVDCKELVAFVERHTANIT